MLKKINLLDCTLRDGGYINNWEFGKEAICDIHEKITSTGIEIFELGFLKNEKYDENRTIFSSQAQMETIIGVKKDNVLYAGMVEVQNPLPIEDLAPRTESSIDIIRIIVWKRLIKEGYEYCKQIKEKGYDICIQPARVDQYSEVEFIEMINLFNQLNPLAIYVVDSWGTLDKNKTMYYSKLADKHMKDTVALGYHGHNNQQQALSCAIAFAEASFSRNIIIDASVYGMGRGAGNLNLELISNYLNITGKKNYSIGPMLDVFSTHLEDIYNEYGWGYTLPYYLTASYNCNPEFVDYIIKTKGASIQEFEKLLGMLKNDEKIIFKKDTADMYLERIEFKEKING